MQSQRPRQTIWYVALILSFLCHAQTARAVDDERPNVVLIYTDDQGSIDVNCYGASDLTTPHMDSIARTGVRFTQFYAAAPVCSPSRAAMLTGRVPQRAGVPGNVSSEKGRSGMPAEQITIAEMLKRAGYRTGHIGKWHLGYTPETMPNGQGFDWSFGHMGGCIDNYSHFFYWNGPNRHDLWRNGSEVWYDGQFFPELMVNETRSFLDMPSGDQPFFLYWAINVPHYPLQATEKWRQHYSDLESPRREYAAFVSTMDEMIGQLLKQLEERNLRDNTIIVFQSDHGHSTEVRTFGGGGNAGPYRGAKFSLFEGGIRVPAMISWPGKLPRGEVRRQFATACDWLPTIADLTGVEHDNQSLDGRSLVDVIGSDAAASPHQTFHWMTGRDQWAVRDGDWKLIGNPIDTSSSEPIRDQRFLVNLSKDVSEKQNLAEQFPDQVTRLEQLHVKWLKTLSPQ